MIEKWIEIRKHDSIGLKAHQIMFDMKTCPSWLNLQELSHLSSPVHSNTRGKPWQAKPLSTFRLEIPANHSIGSEPHLWEARTENRKEDGILGPTGFDLKTRHCKHAGGWQGQPLSILANKQTPRLILRATSSSSPETIWWKNGFTNYCKSGSNKK